MEAYSGRLGDEDSPHCGICDEKSALKFYYVQCNAFLCEDWAGFHNKGSVLKRVLKRFRTLTQKTSKSTFGDPTFVRNTKLK